MARGNNLRRHRWSYKGTICEAMDGPGGLSVAAVHGPGKPLIGGTIRSMTVPAVRFFGGDEQTKGIRVSE